MNIAFIVSSLDNQSPVVLVKALARHSAQLENVSYCIYYFDESGITEPDLNTQKITFTKGFDFSKYQIIHSNGIRPDAFVWWHKAKIKPHCKVLTTIHSFAIPDLTAIYNPIIGRLFGSLWQFF